MGEGDDEPQTTKPDGEKTSVSPAEGTAPIGNDDQKLGQTQSTAADDEVGVPDDVGEKE